MTSSVILLGTHFMFKEELGSRLRGVNYIVHPFNNREDLNQRLQSEKYPPKLVIVDLQHEPAGGLSTIEKVVEQKIPVLAIGEHKKKDILEQAKDAGAEIVITNSQASKSIEKYVKQILC